MQASGDTKKSRIYSCQLIICASLSSLGLRRKEGNQGYAVYKMRKGMEMTHGKKGKAVARQHSRHRDSLAVSSVFKGMTFDANEQT